MDFKNILKSRRSQLELTLDDIGRYVGVSGATVSRWENGEIENIRRDKIAKLAEILGVTPSYLMGWAEKVAPAPEGERKPKLRSVARLESSDITEEMDKSIADYIDYLIQKREKEKREEQQ